MSTHARPRVTGRRLALATLAVAAVIAVPVVMRQEPAGPAPAQTASTAIVPMSRTSAEQQYSALAAEDERLLNLVSSVRPGSGPYVQAVDGVETLVLTAGGPVYDLTALSDLDAVSTLDDGNLLLTRNVLVAPGAKLVIDAPGATLRLRSEASGFASLVAWKADLTLTGGTGAPLRVTSWNSALATPDTEVDDGRAYIRDVNGDMRLRSVDASHLGFWAGRTSGVAWTGSSSSTATGSVADSTFRANHYGAFASQAEGLTITRSAFSDNAVDGLSLHRSTASTTIESSSAHHNGRHGFSADQGSKTVTFRDVTATDNTAHGIYFSGRPLSEGQSAGGASLATYGDVDIVSGLLRDNGGAGLRVVEGHEVSVTGTRVMDNLDGIALADTAAPTRVENTSVTGNRRVGISVTDGAATVSDNRVTRGETGIRVRDAEVTVRDNDVERVTSHAISVVGAARGSSLQDNSATGRGPSALDTYRLDEGLLLDQSGNDVTGWTQDRDNREYWASFIPNHPMLLLWVIVLGVPLLLRLRGRNRGVPVGSAPYRDDLREHRPAPVRVDVGRRVAAGRPS